MALLHNHILAMGIFDVDFEQQLDVAILEEQKSRLVLFMCKYLDSSVYRVAMHAGLVTYIHPDGTTTNEQAKYIFANTYNQSHLWEWISINGPGQYPNKKSFSFVDIKLNEEKKRWELCPRDKHYPVNVIITGHQNYEDLEWGVFEEGTNLCVWNFVARCDFNFEINSPEGGSVTTIWR